MMLLRRSKDIILHTGTVARMSQFESMYATSIEYGENHYEEL